MFFAIASSSTILLPTHWKYTAPLPRSYENEEPQALKTEVTVAHKLGRLLVA